MKIERWLGMYKKENAEKFAGFLQLVEFEASTVTNKGVENEIYIYICMDILGAEYIALNRSFFWQKHKRINKVLISNIGRFLLACYYKNALPFGLNVSKQIIKFYQDNLTAHLRAKAPRYIYVLGVLRQNVEHYIRNQHEINELVQVHLTKSLR